LNPQRFTGGALLGGCLLAAILAGGLVMQAAPQSVGLRTSLGMMLPAVLGVYGAALGAFALPMVLASAGAAAVFWACIGSPQGEKGLGLMAAYFALVSLAFWNGFADFIAARRRR
jgi:hypothetical protein